MALSGASAFGNSLDYDESEFVYLFDLSTKKGRIHGYKGSSSHVTIPSSFTVRETYKDDDGETHTRNHTITVTDIDRLAFADRKFITSVSFHSKLKVIGNEAFRGCTGLKSFRTPSSLNTLGSLVLSGCTGLETAEIDGDNLVVGENLFRECTSLRSVVYGPGVTKIGGGGEVTYSSCWAFNNCTNLVSIVVESTAVRCIPDYFCNVSSLTHLSFAGTITDIGQYALRGCTGLTSIDATLRPTSIGNSAFYNCTNLDPHIDFSDCTGIGNYAFYGCRSMTGTLSLPKLSTVSFEAFYGCLSITGISFESVEAIGAESFYNCKSLALISLPVSLRTIGRSAFYNCTSLASVSLPDSLRSIDSGAFKNCTSLQSVLLPDSLASLGSEVFSGCTGLETAHVDGNGSLRVGSSLFNDCTNLETVIIGTGVKSIEDGHVSQTFSSTYYWGMFAKCSRLKKVEIRTSKLPKLPSYMFRSTPVEEVYIAGGCNEIGEGAFSQCTSLTEVTGDFSAVTNIARNAFDGCFLLAKVPSVQNVEIMGSYAFYNCQSMTGALSLPKLMAVPSSAFYCCRGITGVNLGSATTIDSYAFCGCWTLASVSFSSSLKTIGSDAFQYCYALASVSFPDSLKSIGSYAFQGCRSLKSFKTPHSLKTLDDSALIDCVGLESAEIDGNNLHVGRRLFAGCTNLQTVVYGDGVASISGGYIGNMGGTYYAFSDCTNLKSIMVRSTAVREIPMCLCSVPSLTTISFAGVITNIGQYALRDCTGLTCIDATMRPTSIGNYAFYNCTNLDPHTDFSDCTSIGSSAFYNCRSMTGSISLPKLATTSSSVFSGCSKIESVQFGADLTSIGSSAFSGCTNAFTFAFAGTPPSVGSSAFNNVKRGARGYYTSANAVAWEAVIDAQHMWNGLLMGELPRVVAKVVSADVVAGSITLGWNFEDYPDGTTFKILRTVGNESLYQVTSGVRSATFTDVGFSKAGFVGNTPCFDPVAYQVEPEFGDLSELRSAIVQTRNRYGLFVGIDKYQSDTLSELGACVSDADGWKAALTTYGGCRVPQRIVDETGTKENILKALGDWAKRVKPGDTFFYTHSGHGDVDVLRSYKSTSGYTLEDITASEFATALMEFPKGVALIVVLDTCSSGSMLPTRKSKAKSLLSATPSSVVRSFAESVMGAMNTPPKRRLLSAAAPDEDDAYPKITSGDEIGWLTAVDPIQDSLDGVYSHECLQIAGWKYGGADYDKDGTVDFYELGEFAAYWLGRTFDEYGMTPQMFSPSILSAVCAGRIPSPNVYEKVAAPAVVTASTNEPYRITVSWSAVSGAENYCIAWTINGEQSFDYTTGLSKKFQNLSPETELSVYVKAVNKMDVSLPSETVEGIAKSNEDVETRVTNYDWSICTASENPINNNGTINYDKLNKDHDGDGMTSLQECIAGTDPLNDKSKFAAKISLKTNGEPEVTWEPNTPELRATRVYRTLGKTNLTDADWADVTDKDQSAYRFFKVTVDMP